jgi:hypothetical protein
MPRRVTRFLVVTMFALLTTPPHVTWGDEWPAVARRVPESSCLVVFSDNVSVSCQRFLETELGKVISGPVFASLREDLSTQQRASLLCPRPFCGLDWQDLAALADAGLLAVIPLPEAAAGIALVGFPREAPSDVPDLLRKVTMFHQETGWAVERTVRENGESWIFHPPAKGSASAKSATTYDMPSRGVFWDQDVYGFVSDVKMLPLLGDFHPSRALAGAPDFQQVMESGAPDRTTLSRSGDLEFFVRPWQLTLASERREKPAASRDLLDPLARAERLGFSVLDSVYGRFRLAPEGTADFVVDSRLIIPAQLTGLMRMLDLRAGAPSAWPEWVDASARSVQQWRWSFPAAMEGFGAMFDEFTEPGPDGVGLFDDLLMGLRDDPAGPRVDLAGDLFPLLGPKMLAVSKGENPADNDGGEVEENTSSGARWLYVAECQDTRRAKDILQKFYASDRLVEHTGTGAYDVWTVPSGGSLFVEGESEEIPTIRALAIGEQRLLFATSPSLLQEGLRDEPASDPVRQSELWRPMRAWLEEHDSAESAWCGMLRWTSAETSAYERARVTARAELKSWEELAWSWMLFGSSSDDERPLPKSAPRASRWNHALRGQAAMLEIVEGGWKLSWAHFAEPPTPELGP